MNLEPERCYQAMLARDRRFDGRFFTGVVTTGVYCRPVCPVPPPKLRNVRFYACAAAAETDGFRPCKRCRPETSPGTPAWLGTSAVVSRAMRLIGEGALDGGDVEDLAARLGIGDRQLRRLFAQHLGASPGDVARARRVHFARTLLDQTDLAMADVALSSGFASIRQFNHALKETFGDTPSGLRARRRQTRDAARGLVVKLPYRPPLAWHAMLRFLAARAIPGVESVEAGVYRRTIDVDGEPGTIEIAAPPADDARPHHAPHLTMLVTLPHARSLIALVERARRLCDLDADSPRIDDQLHASAALAPLVEARPGLRVPGAWDGFELAVRAVLGQQVTVRGATTLAGRLVRAFGTPLSMASGPLTHRFPRAEVLANADLGSIGLPRARAQTIVRLARTAAEGASVFRASVGLDDAVRELTAIEGIGAWTAHYIAMRALGEPDAFPETDLGLRRMLGDANALAPAGRVLAIAEAWRPWRAYAALHLWTQLAANSAVEENTP